MSDPLRLRPEDRGDYEAVLDRALRTPDLRNAVAADPTGRSSARLRLRALADADEVAAAARDAYRQYLAVRASAREDARGDTATAGSVLPAVAVLTPLVAGSSAVVLLPLGHILRWTGVRGTLPGSLITAGWVLALVAAAGALAALGALLVTALRGSGPAAHTARLERAREAWQRALLTHGMLPHLRRCLAEEPSPLPAPAAPPPRLKDTVPQADRTRRARAHPAGPQSRQDSHLACSD